MIGTGSAPCDEGVVRAERDTGGCAKSRRRGVLAATSLGSSLAFLDGSMVGVALPAIQAAFDVGVTALQWVSNAYLLFLGALMLAGGAAGDRFGRRRVFTVGVVAFATASLAAGLAPGIGALQLARAAQGVGGALLVPCSLALLAASFPAGERGRSIGTWAAATAVTAALGPTLGGYLVDTVSWRPVFFVTPPLAAITLLLTWRYVEESRSGRAATGRLDWPGAATVTAAVSALAYGLIQATPLGWGDPRVVVALVAAVCLATAFVVVERRASDPLVPPGIFRSAAFRGTNLLTLLLYFALGGAFFFLPFLLIQVQGYSATAAGAAFLPFTVLVGGLSPWSGSLFDRYGARLPLVVGPLVAAAGFALLGLPAAGSGPGASYWSGYFPALAVLGVGMAVSVAPLTTAVMAAVDEELAGTASGVNNATSRLAGMLAVALLGALAVGFFQAQLEPRLEATGLPGTERAELMRESSKLAGLKKPSADDGALPSPADAAIDAAFVATFRRLMIIAAAFAAASAGVAAVTLRGKELVGATRDL